MSGLCFQVLQKFHRGAFFRVPCIEGDRRRKNMKEVFFKFIVLSYADQSLSLPYIALPFI